FAFQIESASDKIPQFEREEVIHLQDVRLKVYYCPTELALRQVLQYGEPAVLLTPLDFQSIHREVTDRFVQRTIHRIQPTHQLAALFRAQSFDRRLGRWKTLTEWLVEYADQHSIRYAPAASGVLSEKEAWAAIFAQIFGGYPPEKDERRSLFSLLD